MEDKPLGIGDYIRGIFFVVISLAGSLAVGMFVGSFISPNPDLGTILGFIFWMAFMLIILHAEGSI